MSTRDAVMMLYSIASTGLLRARTTRIEAMAHPEAEPAESVSRIEGDENGEPAGQHRVPSGQNGLTEPISQRNQPSRGKRRKRAPLADLLGRDVVLDGSLFSTPGTTYAARIMKKDPTHRGAVIIRFEEDNSRIWLPAEEVRRFLVEDECGEQVDDARADTLAAQVLVSLSGRSSADDYSQMRAERDLREGHTAQSPLAGQKRPAESLQV